MNLEQPVRDVDAEIRIDRRSGLRMYLSPRLLVRPNLIEYSICHLPPWRVVEAKQSDRSYAAASLADRPGRATFPAERSRKSSFFHQNRRYARANFCLWAG